MCAKEGCYCDSFVEPEEKPYVGPDYLRYKYTCMSCCNDLGIQDINEHHDPEHGTQYFCNRCWNARSPVFPMATVRGNHVARARIRIAKVEKMAYEVEMYIRFAVFLLALLLVAFLSKQDDDEGSGGVSE